MDTGEWQLWGCASTGSNLTVVYSRTKVGRIPVRQCAPKHTQHPEEQRPPFPGLRISGSHHPVVLLSPAKSLGPEPLQPRRYAVAERNSPSCYPSRRPTAWASPLRTMSPPPHSTNGISANRIFCYLIQLSNWLDICRQRNHRSHHHCDSIKGQKLIVIR